MRACILHAPPHPVTAPFFPTAAPRPHSRLRHMDSLADHQAPVQNKHAHNRVKRKRGSLEPHTEGKFLHRPPLVHPVRHDLHHAQTHRNRGALEVLALARLILRHHSNSNVEARQPSQAAEDEEGEEEVVDGGTQTQGEGGGGGAHAEGDQVGEGVEFLAHEGGLLAPARDLAVHEVEEQAQGDEAQRPVEVGVVVGVVLGAVAEGGEDGNYAAEAWGAGLVCMHVCVCACVWIGRGGEGCTVSKAV